MVDATIPDLNLIKKEKTSSSNYAIVHVYLANVFMFYTVLLFTFWQEHSIYGVIATG